MLRLYSARECADSEKFIYDHISGEAIVIVPDQYALVAERQALRYSGRTCLFDIEILSMSRLGLRLLTEKGIENIPVLDRYGRYMLISRIIRRHRSEFSVFASAAGKPAFTEMVSDFIADMRQQDCGIEALEDMRKSGEVTELLRAKLAELEMIIGEYEEEIAGSYTDSEEYISAYIDAISSSEYIKNKEIWVYGFDSLTSKAMDTVVELAKYSRAINFMLGESDFKLWEWMKKRFLREAERAGIPIEFDKPGAGCEIVRPEELKKVERSLFARNTGGTSCAAERIPEGGEPAPDSGGGDADADDTGGGQPVLKLVEAANPYCEAESAAIYITSLLRDEGYRMRDIVVIANEEDKMHDVVKRVFAEYDLGVFTDARRSITDTRAVRFILNMLSFLRYNYRTGALMSMLKSGLSGIEDERIEDLDRYVRKYNIRGGMWAAPFKYGSFEYGEEEFAGLEATRSEIMDKIIDLTALSERSGTVGEFIDNFVQYLEDVWDISGKVESLAEELETEGMPEAAQETEQSLEAAFSIMRQAEEILGTEDFDIGEFTDLYKVGMTYVDVGIIPPALDGITLGTMRRTRPGSIKVAVILGANEGILPLDPQGGGLFSQDEKEIFKENDIAIGRLDDIKSLEEKTAMYRMVSKPSDKLYVSYSLSDGAGEDRKPSMLVTALEDVMGLHPEKDTVSRGFGMQLINGQRSSLRHTLIYLKGRFGNEGSAAEGSLDGLAGGVLRRCEEDRPQEVKRIMRIALDDNRTEHISGKIAAGLFAKGGEYIFSPTGLEKQFRCPFEHFVSYGLRPEEDREFRSGGREIGEVYHSCIMRVSEKLTQEGGALRADRKKEIGEEAARLVDETLCEIAENYRGGLFISGAREEYRMERIREICEKAACAVMEQILCGDVELIFLEEEFGRGCKFRPPEMEVAGERILVRGRIDRVDILRGGKARVIDYKTGLDKLDVDQMRIGYKMQLMVYMEGVRGGNYEPAGVFYFNISDREVNLNAPSAKRSEENQEKAIAENEDRFKLRGLYITEGEDAGSNIDIRGSSGVSIEVFEDIESDVRDAVRAISAGIISGDISIEPTRLRKDSSQNECRYCQYRSICRFDLSYEGNRFRLI